MKGALASSLALVVAAACAADGGPGEPAPEPRPPLGVEGKPVVELPTGQAIADELLVRFHPVLPAREVLAAAADVEGEIVYRGPRTGYYLVRFADLEAMLTALDLLRRDPRVVEAIPNHVISGTGPITVPGYEMGILQWNLYGMTLDPFGNRRTAEGVTVALLDTGVAYEDYQDARGEYRLAPDLAGVTFASGYDFINDDAHPNDDQRHGTHLASVIAASSGIASVAPGATLLPVKVLDSANTGTELALAEGLRFAADQGADVVNMSLTFPLAYFPSRLIQSAVDHAARAGVILVAAAGNQGQPLVPYPAAFRDVIAVGGSDLPDGWVTRGELPWDDAFEVLERADYSNHSYQLDVLAPSGSVTKDANGDGKPEGILAQTFEEGDPTSFDYFFYAGTSQATAEVSGLAAVMLAQRRLTAHETRSILTASARELDSVLSLEAGRGMVHLHKAVSAARNRHATDERARFYAGVTISLHDGPGGTVARATVEILDAAYAPAAGVEVYGMFTGATFGSVTGRTNEQGVATFQSGILDGNPIAGFQVDAVTAGHGRGDKLVFDRPQGFVRIDSGSLGLLAAFGRTFDVPDDTTGSGPITVPGSAGGRPSGAGPITVPGYTLPDDPALTPITIGYDPVLFGADYRRTLVLQNFSWGLSTVPMAVAVDEAWFLATFPDAIGRRVISYGRGTAASPLYFDETSFPRDVEYEITSRLLLLVLTFTSGVPITLGPITVPGSTVFVDATAYGSSSAAGMSAQEWERLSAAYLEFAGTPMAAPVGSYGDALNAAGLPIAPVALDAGGGSSALGVVRLTP